MKRVFLFGDRKKRANYAAALEAYGMEAVISLNAAEGEDCHGLLLPGGADLDPLLYGQQNQGSRGIDPELDRAELALARQFVESGRPVLGICRGLQVLNVAFGGSLVQDLPTAAAHCWEEPEGDKCHRVSAPRGSFLHRLYGEDFSVNSAHHQGAGQLAQGFLSSARAEDGVIEGLEWPEKAVFAVQFHPERMTLNHRRQDTVDGGEIFRFFLGILEERGGI